jgi:hypothetical protein
VFGGDAIAMKIHQVVFSEIRCGSKTARALQDPSSALEVTIDACG